MNAEEFEKIFEYVVGNSREVLVEKAKEYATDDDRLHNFKKAAALSGVSEAEALWGFLVKHLVSISDMVGNGDTTAFSPRKWDEKIGDAINYLILLRAQVNEDRTKLTETVGYYDVPTGAVQGPTGDASS